MWERDKGIDRQKGRDRKERGQTSRNRDREIQQTRQTIDGRHAIAL